MRRVRALKIDSFADYELIEDDMPAAKENEILIRIGACSLGYVDALLALGGYQVKPPLPFTPGQEVGGIVEAVGSAVTRLSPGDRVMGWGFGGGLADFGVLPEDSVFRIPDTMSFAQASVFRINYLTALHGLMDRAALESRDTILVFGAAGGVGTAAVQLASLLGANVIAAASSNEKRDYALANGAALSIDTNPDGWRDRLKALTEGRGVDVIFDPVCGPLFEPAYRSLAWGGRHLVVGFAGGPIPALPANLPLVKGAALTGVDVRQFQLFEPERSRAHLERLLGWVGDGRLVPPVGRVFPLPEFRDALDFALGGKGLGKTVVELSAG